eukprot:m51a1_g12856 putative guanylate cyclase (483) ;mRNA; r:526-3071
MDSHGADTLICILEEMFDTMSNILEENGAIIDKYIGDSIMALWGCPEAVEKSELRSCKAVLEIHSALAQMNSRFAKSYGIEMGIRVGWHSGPVYAGNVGSSNRLNYTVLGNSVNLASRLEALNKEMGTHFCVTDSIRDKCSVRYAFRCLGSIRIRGFASAVMVHEFLGETSQLTPENEAVFDNFRDLSENLHSGRCTVEELKAYSIDHPEDTVGSLCVLFHVPCTCWPAWSTTHGIDASFLSKREPGDVTLKDVIPRSCTRVVTAILDHKRMSDPAAAKSVQLLRKDDKDERTLVIYEIKCAVPGEGALFNHTGISSLLVDMMAPVLSFPAAVDWNIKGIAFSQIVVILLFNGIDDIPAPVPCQEHNKCGRSRKRGKPEKTKSTVFWKRVDMFFAVWTDYDEATRWPRRLTSELLDEQLAEKDWQPAEPDREMAEDSQLAELALQLAEQGGVTDKDQVYQMIMETIRDDSAQPPAKRKKREG